MPASVTLSQLESHLWGAANFLRGPVDVADFKSYVFPLLFFKRLSDETQAQTDAPAESATTALPQAIAVWLKGTASVRQTLQSLLEMKP